jgi:hypothetical protein
VLPFGASAAQNLLEAAVTAVSILGGAMAYESGLAATEAVAEREPPENLSQRVNEGMAKGFVWGWPLSVITLIIELWA